MVVVVRLPMLPTPEEDANPFEGQGANDRVIFFAFASVVLDVIASPLALGEGKAGKLMEGLPEEFGTGMSKVHESSFTAASGDRTDPGKGLDISSRLVTRTIRSKSSQEPRRQRGSSPRELAEKRGLGMVVENLFDSLVVILNHRIERLDELGIHLAEAAAALNDGRVRGKSFGCCRQI